MDDSLPHERTAVPAIRARRVQLDPLSLPTGIPNLAYAGPINDDNGSAPLRAIGRADGNATYAGMRRSLFGSQHVQRPTTECGSSSSITIQPGGHGACRSGMQLWSQALHIGGGAFRPTLARMGDHAGARAMQTDGVDGGCSLQVRSQLRSPPYSSPDTATRQGQVHLGQHTCRTSATATKRKVGQWSDDQMHAAILALERGAKVQAAA